jgi:hypothetical protein
MVSDTRIGGSGRCDLSNLDFCVSKSLKCMLGHSRVQCQLPRNDPFLGIIPPDATKRLTRDAIVAEIHCHANWYFHL